MSQARRPARSYYTERSAAAPDTGTKRLALALVATTIDDLCDSDPRNAARRALLARRT